MKALHVTLRPAQLADLDAIVALDRATDLAPHWPVASYASILDALPIQQNGSIQRCLLIAENTPADQAPHLVGFAVGQIQVQVRPAAETALCIAELEDIVVAANCRHAGVGRALCTAVLGWCRSQGATEAILEVRSANIPAIALYTQLGFEPIGRRPGYYRDPADAALAMRLRWPSAVST